MALKERGGSSPHAIAKYMEEKHKAVLPANFRKMLGLQLKNSAAKGKLIKIKASYKLAGGSAPAEKVKKPVAIAGTKRKAPEAKKPKKEVAPKKMTPKKSVKKVVKPKQSKSIKSPAAKKSKKAA